MIVVRTPLRVSFAGGGSDIPEFYAYNPGAVLSVAINKYVYLSLNKSFEQHLRVSYSKTELVKNAEELEHTRVKAALKHFGINSGLEIVNVADVPARGTGLGSSSSFTVALIHGLKRYLGQNVEPRELAELACKIEIGDLGEKIGKQDQYIASFGGLRFFEFFPDGAVSAKAVSYKPELLQELQNRLMLFYTGTQRSAHNILRNQISGYAQAQSVQNVKTMVDLAFLMKSGIEAGKLDDFGFILDESWRLKKTLSETISNPQIDSMYELAKKNGAIGGKLLGAGGGGFLLVYAHPEHQPPILQALGEYVRMPFSFEETGSQIVYNN